MKRPPFIPLMIGTGFGAGFWPWGPGTAGAFVASLIWYGLSYFLGDAPLLMITSALILCFQVLGIWSADKLEPYWGEDPSKVVVDEMVGVWIALLAAPSGNIYFCVAAFLLFRFFDILKPFGVRHMEKMGGGVGVMMDDVLAGVYSFFILFVVRFGIMECV